MPTAMAVVFLILIPDYVLAQPPAVRRFHRPALTAEMAVKSALEQLAVDKKLFERDIQVLVHLHQADDALSDTMQPANAIQKAYDHVGKAKSLEPEFLVMQGVIKIHQELESARRSAGMADFGRLRTILREAEGPAARVAARNALMLEEEILAWMKVQELISQHVRSVSEIVGESLRAAQQ